MKITHYQGYGTVNAFKVHADKGGIVIKVVGNHEYGLDRSGYVDDVYNWLVRRFDRKNCPDYRHIESVEFSYGNDEIVDGVSTEVGIYTIRYRD